VIIPDEAGRIVEDAPLVLDVRHAGGTGVP
jgi:hypothetical protein